MSSFRLTLNRNIAANPVTRAIERQRTKKWADEAIIEMSLTRAGAPCQPLLIGIAEAVSMASHSLAGWDGDGEVQDLLLGAIRRIDEMSKAGWIWVAEHFEPLRDAVDCATQVLCAVDPRAKAEAFVRVHGAANG